MDMKISGSGQIASGEYNNVSINGSAKINGYIRCLNFSCAGSARAFDKIECENGFSAAGSFKSDSEIKADTLSFDGSFSCGGNITSNVDMSCSGSMKCGGSIKAGAISVDGLANINGDVEAETVKVFGVLNCGGLLNAESIEIRFKNGMEIGSIGGSRINIYPENFKRKIKLPLFSSLIKGASAVRVNNSIEGDSIALEGVVTPRVSGRIVAISDGCEIDLVQYSEQIEISPNAKVGKTEKI